MTDLFNDAALRLMLERASKATQPPWWYEGREEGDEKTSDRQGYVMCAPHICVAAYTTDADGGFIAQARTDVPRLCAALRAAWERIKTLETERDYDR